MPVKQVDLWDAAKGTALKHFTHKPQAIAGPYKSDNGDAGGSVGCGQGNSAPQPGQRGPDGQLSHAQCLTPPCQRWLLVRPAAASTCTSSIAKIVTADKARSRRQSFHAQCLTPPCQRWLLALPVAASTCTSSPVRIVTRAADECHCLGINASPTLPVLGAGSSGGHVLVAAPSTFDQASAALQTHPRHWLLLTTHLLMWAVGAWSHSLHAGGSCMHAWKLKACWGGLLPIRGGNCIDAAVS